MSGLPVGDLLTPDTDEGRASEMQTAYHYRSVLSAANVLKRAREFESEEPITSFGRPKAYGYLSEWIRMLVEDPPAPQTPTAAALPASLAAAALDITDQALGIAAERYVLLCALRELSPWKLEDCWCPAPDHGGKKPHTPACERARTAVAIAEDGDRARRALAVER